MTLEPGPASIGQVRFTVLRTRLTQEYRAHRTHCLKQQSSSIILTLANGKGGTLDDGKQRRCEVE